MNTQFNPNKPYQCRDGCKAKIVETELYGNYPVLIIKNDRAGKRCVLLLSSFREWGVAESPNDLINIPEKKMLDVWVNVYPDFETIYSSKEKADLYCSAKRAACLHIQRAYVEGEGL